jgi:hypothetical protein
MSYTIGVNAHIILDGTGYYIKPLSYKIKRPRISKAQYRADGTLSYVDIGAGKRTFSMTIIARNELPNYDGSTSNLTGEQYRDALITSYTGKIATAITYVDPTNTSISVYFDDYSETITDLKSQIIPYSVGNSVAPSYECEIVLLEQ